MRATDRIDRHTLRSKQSCKIPALCLMKGVAKLLYRINKLRFPNYVKKQLAVFIGRIIKTLAEKQFGIVYTCAFLEEMVSTYKHTIVQNVRETDLKLCVVSQFALVVPIRDMESVN